MANSYAVRLDPSTGDGQFIFIHDANISPADSLDLTGITGCTIEFWLKLNSLPTSGQKFYLVSKIQSSDSVEVGYYTYLKSDGKIAVGYRNDDPFNVSTHIESASAVFTSEHIGVWMHLALVIDLAAQSFVAYRSAQGDVTSTAFSSASASPANAYAIADNGRNFQFGDDSTATSVLDGYFDDLRVWNVKRSRANIEAAFETELAGTETGLIGYWKANGTADETSGGLTDHSPNSNRLTLNTGSFNYTRNTPFDKELLYTSAAVLSVSIDDTPLTNELTATDETAIASDDTLYADQHGSAGTTAMFLFTKKNAAENNTDKIVVTVKARSTLAPTSRTVYLQAYNRVSDTWTTIDSDAAAAANTPFTLSGEIISGRADYYDEFYAVSCRVYQ